MRFAIVGSGGLGCLYGGMLARSGADVTLIARGANLDTLRTHGLDVDLFTGERFHVDVHASDDTRTIGIVDAIFFCVKSYDVETAARQAIPMVGPETLMLPVQNGVDAADRIAAVVGEDHVVMGLAGAGATLERPGVVAKKGPGTVRIRFGPDRRTDGRRARRVKDALNAAGIGAEVSQDIEREVWEKYLITPVTLGFMALNRLSLGSTLSCPASAEVAFRLMEETEAVGRARGAPLAEGAALRAHEGLRTMVATNPGARGSMYFDLVAGKRLELDAINGTVVRMGQALGVATPYNFTVYGGLLPYVDGAPTATA